MPKILNPQKPFDIIREELQKVTYLLEQEMKLKTGHVSNFIDMGSDWMDKYFYPAMLILSSKLVGQVNPKTISMACVVEFINLASQIHKKYSDQNVFQVLIGDFLYAKFFLYLHRYEMLKYLKKLSQTICEIHEAGVLSFRLNSAEHVTMDDYLTIAQKEQGLLMGDACCLGGELGGGSADQVKHLYDFGFNLGTFWGFTRWGIKEVPLNYLSRAEESLFLLPDCEERSVFRKVLDLFIDKPQEAIKFMVG